MKAPLYKWSGQYVGFISGGNLFDASSTYLGWVDEEGRCWSSSGSFLGELVEENYVLRRTTMVPPVPKVPKVPPVPPVPPVAKVNRVGKVGRVGWTDALADL